MQRPSAILPDPGVAGSTLSQGDYPATEPTESMRNRTVEQAEPCDLCGRAHFPGEVCEVIGALWTALKAMIAVWAGILIGAGISRLAQ